MRKLLVTLALGAAAALPALAQPESAGLTLEDCYRLALKQSETVAVRRELITEAESRFTQALSGVLPRASFVSVDKRQDGSGGSQFTLREVPDRHFEFSQPLFSGFKEFAAMKGAKAERRQRVQERVRAEQLLLVDVSDAFHLLLEQRKDLEALRVTRDALAERIAELNEREKLGRSRPSEVVSAQAQVYRLDAEIEGARSRETVARQLLEFLTGLEPIGPLADADPLAGGLRAEGDYLAGAAARPDVRAAEEQMTVAKQEVKVARAGFWPTAGLEGNYFLERAGASKEVTWDAALRVEVPIFDGGQTFGAVREASSKERQAALLFSEARRRAVREARDAYARLDAALARRAALAKALEATDENYRLQVEEYRLSLVNNLDVLEVLQELQDARRDLIQSEYEVKRLFWVLQAAAGALPTAQGENG